jgi:Ser/Thr protein kinase RdoA (MazF antagonist)
MWRPPPPSIERLLALHGLRGCLVRQIADLDCTVWRVRSEQADMALRIYAEDRNDPAPIDTEIAWLRALSQAGLHVPCPVADQRGRYRMSWQAEPDAVPRHAVLLSWLPGRMLYAGLRPVHLRRIGELAAHLHNSIQPLVSSRQAHTPDLSGWADGQRRLPATYPRGLEAAVQRSAKQLLALQQAWPRDAAHWSFLHGDLHPWNIVFRRGAAGAIDFTDCGWGWTAQDLAGVLRFMKHPLTPRDAHLGSNYPQLRDALLEGYTALRPVPDTLLAQIEPLMAEGMLTTLQWIVDDWPRPDHRAWGPGFLSGLGAALAETLG